MIASKEETINNDAISLFMYLSNENIALLKKAPMTRINKQIKGILIYGNKLFLISKSDSLIAMKDVQYLFVANIQTNAGKQVENTTKNKKINTVSIDV